MKRVTTMEKSTQNGKTWKQAYDDIQNLILSSAVKPGEAVTEIGLSKRLGLGRTPVREALHKLEQEGLIVTENRRKRVYILTVAEAEAIFDIKIALESAVCGWAAERGDDKDRAALGRILERMRALLESRPPEPADGSLWFKKWVETDEALHRQMYRMAGNKRAEAFILQLNRQWHRVRVGMLAIEGRLDRSLEEHTAFIEAILARDARAAGEAMTQHLTNLKRMLVQILNMFHYPAA
jgi:DNA-binding GntR family transcriptional regulator